MTEPNADDLTAVRAAWPLSDRYRDAELWHAIAIPLTHPERTEFDNGR